MRGLSACSHEVIMAAQLYYGGGHVPPRGKIKTGAEMRQLESAGSYTLNPQLSCLFWVDRPGASKAQEQRRGACPVFTVGFLLVKLNSSRGKALLTIRHRLLTRRKGASFGNRLPRKHVYLT